eukprot:Phypoly_transcript_21227.p1 GENE.Phypoly_transcript_21227~~Phypoly_transcript_21227.p1  ORF type:complete len:117 (-),score=15.48 Phypoly_transcript_21227:100-450(-)
MCNCGQVNRTWWSITNSEILWQTLFHAHFKKIPKTRTLSTWKLEYKSAMYHGITLRDIEELSRILKIPFYLTSAKFGTNVDKVLEDVVAQLVKCASSSPQKTAPDKKGFFSKLFRK